MKTKRHIPRTIATLAAFAMAVSSAQATITFVNTAEGFLGSNKTQVTTTHNGATQVLFDATGADKLVFVLATESGFNNQAVTSANVSFNGVQMLLGVQENTHVPGVAGDPETRKDGGIAALFYLDNPFQGVGTFTVGATTTGGGLNGGWVSIIGLKGTLDGIGNTGATWHTQTSSGNVSTSLTTSGNDSLVIAAIENSGTPNGAGNPGPTALAPLTLLDNGFWGSQWGSGASAFQQVALGGTTLNPTFLTNAGFNIHVIAAEFLAVPEPSVAMTLALGLLGLALRRRRP
jgi:hypothetical protein